MATVWVDTDTGTWGIAERNLVIFEANVEELEILDSGTDTDRIELANLRSNELSNYELRLE